MNANELMKSAYDRACKANKIVTEGKYLSSEFNMAKPNPYTEEDRKKHRKIMRQLEYGRFLLERFNDNLKEALRSARFSTYEY